MISILGPTATGKTRLAALLANAIGGEIISADSRQVYKHMNLGTGKDYEDYVVNGVRIPYHLVDIAEPGTEFNIFEFKKEALKAIREIRERGKVPILCGGSGMYLESVLADYTLLDVPENNELREQLNQKSDNELKDLLLSFAPTHNITDFETHERLIRAIEIKTFCNKEGFRNESLIQDQPIFGIAFPREEVRKRITERLDVRLKSGMLEEVQALINSGVSVEMLHRYGLEYRWITLYLQNQINYQTLFEKLNIAIHQFSKRQMIWFRRMERKGFHIQWIDGHLSEEEKIACILKCIS